MKKIRMMMAAALGAYWFHAVALSREKRSLRLPAIQRLWLFMLLRGVR